MTHAPSPTLPTSGGFLTDRGFWGIYVVAWLVFLALYVSVGLAEDQGVLWSLGLGATNAVPPALVGALVAWRRRDLLRPERTLLQTILIHVGVGILFSVATAALLALATMAVGVQEEAAQELGKGTIFLYRMVSSAFLYVVLAGFLMWTESLRRVHESRSLAAREAMLRAQAEAKALRAQFNPHFVFNTLHSLMLLVRADPPAAERAIEDVATLIRYASILQRREVDVVPLVKELAVAQRYLGLEQLRLEDRLRVEFDVEVEPERVSLPAFALQTLLDNAVRHGMEPHPEGGVVRVSIRRDGERLVLTVADDGAGADPSTVSAARNHGLDLLTRRLDALYGEEASLAWETAPGHGFTA
ncbi:MAG TPA: histidine kinase, partial [Longimicrobiales bacterium]|nr:histidine kinase [Longimicrobiales bacterium]